MNKIYYLTLSLLMTFSLAVSAEPKPFTAQYEIFQGSDKVGQMTQTLVEVSDYTYRLQTDSKAKLYFVKISYSEDAIFVWEDNQAKPMSYIRTSDTSFSSERKTVQTFNWPSMTETGTYKDKSWDLELTSASHSPLTDIVQFQEELKKAPEPIQSMAFLVHDRGSSKNESFHFEAMEEIKTPAGTFNTWRYGKTHNNPKRASTYWFAPELDFIPVRVQQFKDGEEQANMIIRQIEFD